ncbi:MAG TPA: hypothetical protein VHS31_09900 [Tepidisphaeraceae bacterium]|nr:hypothetical protein [Tepidisphaeraceae bacterium]
MLKKDWRVYQVATIGCILIVLTIHIIAAITFVDYDRPIQQSDVLETFFTAGLIGLLVSAGFAGIYGGGAFSLERRERSADFLAVMPTTRGRIITSKAIVSILCPLVIWLFHLCEISFIFSLDPARFGNKGDYWIVVTIIFGASVMFFGLAWLLSTFLSSAAISFGIAIVILLGSLTLIETARQRHSISDLTAQQIDYAWTFGMGTICFIAGVIYYLRRVEP